VFPEELEATTFRASNGEYGWTRDQIPVVLIILAQHGLAVLGGELWWVPAGSRRWIGLIPQCTGPPAVYSWTWVRRSGETWESVVARSLAETAGGDRGMG
jgi:hypothetical protein